MQAGSPKPTHPELACPFAQLQFQIRYVHLDTSHHAHPLTHLRLHRAGNLVVLQARRVQGRVGARRLFPLPPGAPSRPHKPKPKAQLDGEPPSPSPFSI